MDFKSKIEGFTTHQVIHLILELLGRISAPFEEGSPITRITCGPA
jgi:hypothetical protein